MSQPVRAIRWMRAVALAAPLTLSGVALAQSGPAQAHRNRTQSSTSGSSQSAAQSGRPAPSRQPPPAKAAQSPPSGYAGSPQPASSTSEATHDGTNAGTDRNGLSSNLSSASTPRHAPALYFGGGADGSNAATAATGRARSSSSDWP